MNTDHITELRQQIQGMKTQLPPVPWQHVTTHAIGGLEMVGFADDSDLLLAVSTSGRGLFNCLTGEKTARDDDNLAWHNWAKLSAQGIGALTDQSIRLAGLYGGGMNTITKDGWQLYNIAPTWPDYRIILCPPRTSIHNNLVACVQVAQDYEIRSYGFSQTGRSFIVAQNHTLHIYARG